MLNLFLQQTWFCNNRASRRKNPKPRARFQINNEDKEFLNYLITNQPEILPYFSVSLTPSNFAVGQPQEVGFDPSLAFRQSTGGAYHALCDAIGIDRIVPHQSMPSATSVNLSVRSNGVTDARVHHTKEQGMKANVNNCAFLSLGDAVQYESAWIGNGRPTIGPKIYPVSTLSQPTHTLNQPCIQSSIHSTIRPYTHPHMHSPIHSFTHPSVHPPTCPSTYIPIHTNQPPIHSLTGFTPCQRPSRSATNKQPTHTCTQPTMHPIIHPFNHPSVHSPTDSNIHPFIHKHIHSSTH